MLVKRVPIWKKFLFNIHLSFANKTIEPFIAKNEIDDNFNIVEQAKIRNTNQTTNEKIHIL